MTTIDYDAKASDYARHRQVHPDVLRSLVLTGGVGPGSKVLEVGCGTGNYILALDSLVGCECWGIDPSQGMLTTAEGRSDDVGFHLGQAESLSFRPDYFDLVFSVDVIHHLERCGAYFHEARRVLTGGGKVCTVTDSEWIIRHRQPLAVYFPGTVERELKRYPRLSELGDLMQQAGFGQVTQDSVVFRYQISDAQAYQDRVFSALHSIPEDAFRRGVERMERDLRAGPIACASRYTLLWGTK
jgi:ubiquinone/menaquinone biosynthesis C-methylase UbiE